MRRLLLSGLFTFFAFVALFLPSGLRAETLKNPRLIQTGSDPRIVVTGDLNGDGNPDLIYLDGGNPSLLHVMLGNGDGTFQPATTVQLPQNIGVALAVADVNNDGKPDVILTSGGISQGEIGVLLGKGDGTFQPIVISQFINNPGEFPALRAVAVADFNNDGAADLAVSNGFGGIYILLGNNTGSFTLKTTLPDQGAPGTLFTADLNGDGNPDLVVHDIDGADAGVFLGNGDGTFQLGVDYTGPHHIGALVLADMDGDGHLDMVVSGFGNTIDILKGNPDGTFSNSSEGGAANAGIVLAVADYNGDGILDIATLLNGGITILLGQGHLSYSPTNTFVAGPDGINIVSADFNKDGHLDLAAPAPDGIALLFGNADGTFQSAETYGLAGGTFSIAIADFTGDKIPDIAADTSPLDPAILVGDGTGQFTVKQSQTSSGLGNVMLAGDFNGDGKADLFFSDTGSGSDLVLFGNGDGTFSTPVNTGLTTIGFADVTTGDFNNDGRTDIASATQQEYDVLLGQSNESFDLIKTLAPRVALATPAAADFNRDGKLDLLLLESTGGRAYLGNGDGTFKAGNELPIFTNVFIAGDVDGDGNPDIVTIETPGSFTQTYSIAQIFYGNGDGTFQNPVTLPLARNYAQVAIADMNGDGKPDLVFSDGKVIAVIHNNGNRQFGPEVHYLAGSINAFAIGELISGGLNDVVCGGSAAVTVLLSQPGGAAVSGGLSVSPEPSGLAQPFTLSLTIGAANGVGSPTGSVIFSIDGIPIATVPVSGATVSFTLSDSSAFALGQHGVTAHYSGDGTFLPGVFAAVHNVVPVVHPTNTTLAAAPNPAIASQTVTLTATVTSPGPTPTGIVTFVDGSTNLGTGTLNANGVAVFDTTLLSAGTHNITASYLGDINSAPSTSSPVSEIVNAFATTTTLTSMPSTIQAGATIALSATVTSSSGAPTGAVVFFDGTTPLGAEPLDAAGVAVQNTIFSSGSHSVTATYQANASFAASTSAPLIFAANSSASFGPSNTSVAASQDPLNSDGVLFTAVVTSKSGRPAGDVGFFADNARLGTAVIDSSGHAALAGATVPSGTHYIVAVYSGSAGLSASAGSTLLTGKSAGRPDFSLTLSTSSVTLPIGQSAGVQVNVSPLNGFNQNVLLSCSADSPQVSCLFQPASLIGGGSAKMTIDTSQLRSKVLAAPLRPWRGILPAVIGFVFVVFLSPGRFRRTITVLSVGLLCLAVVLGCGSQQIRTPSSFMVTVVATTSHSASQVTHSAELEVVVLEQD